MSVARLDVSDHTLKIGPTQGRCVPSGGKEADGGQDLGLVR